MNKPDEQTSNSVLNSLPQLADVWAIARAVVEHERATASPTEQPFAEREILAMCLAEKFQGKVTATTLCKVFGLHHSQVSKMVEKLVQGGFLEKSTETVSRKSGKGTPLHLTHQGNEELQRIKIGIGSRFEYLVHGLDDNQIKKLLELTCIMQKAAIQRFRERVFLERAINF